MSSPLLDQPQRDAFIAKLDDGFSVIAPAGVGKTEVAKALSAARGCPLIRLQCYEGLDAHARSVGLRLNLS